MQPPFSTYDAGVAGTGSPGSVDSSGKPNVKRFYGKYRGKVVENVDPLFLGRVIPQVPAVSDLPLNWAMPCVPYAGMEVGFYAIPPIDANVWIEFEAGDPSYPIWTGCFWEEGQVPLGSPPPGTFVFKTETTTVTIVDDPEVGGLTLEIIPPAVDEPITITMNSTGIEVEIENLLALNSGTTNITCEEAAAIESPETNISGETLTIETETTNIAGSLLSIESEETNITSSALTIETEETNIASEAVTVESAEVNVVSAAITTESAETNVASAAVTVEGTLDILGVATEDGLPVMVIPI